MIPQFCRSQIKCIEDTEDTWTCAAHLDEGYVPVCSFSLNDIKIIEDFINGEKIKRKIMTKQGRYIGCCQDWEEIYDSYK